ncbi:MAG: HDOD domain-containing protein [Betaproteobacteria bacterium]|nr:HDOD domain-containing protein [Betaproteobacteria bacterium]
MVADDADTGKLEAIFRQEPKLSYNLLRLVNSAAIAPRNPITSFAQAINLRAGASSSAGCSYWFMPIRIIASYPIRYCKKPPLVAVNWKSWRLI